MNYCSLTVHKLIIKINTKSRAKLLGIKVNYYIVGQRYDASLTIQNIGDTLSPKGYCGIDVKYPESRAFITNEVHFPAIEPSKFHTSKNESYDVLSGGVANFTVPRRQSHESNEELSFYSDDGKTIKQKEEIFHSIYCQHPEAIYEYWALITSAVGLGIIALEKIWNLIIFLMNYLSACAS